MTGLLTAITNYLVHKLRSPLAVISNDLHFLKTLLPEQELVRPLKKCSELAKLLEDFMKAFDPDTPRESFDVRELLSRYCGDIEGAAQVHGNKSAVSMLFDLLFPLISSCGASIRSIRITDHPKAVMISTNCAAKALGYDSPEKELLIGLSSENNIQIDFGSADGAVQVRFRQA